jgi:hypothetical protein
LGIRIDVEIKRTGFYFTRRKVSVVKAGAGASLTDIPVNLLTAILDTQFINSCERFIANWITESER